jgi:hypothetical protein
MATLTLPCLNIQQGAMLGVTGKEKEGSPVLSEIGAVVRPYLDIRAWLMGEVGFQGWLDKLERLNSKQVVGRCFTLWRERVGGIQWERQFGVLSVLRDTCYLRQTLFNRSSRSGRIVTMSQPTWCSTSLTTAHTRGRRSWLTL